MTDIPIKPINSKFNDTQWQAIHLRNANILVSASAGSGKTTVLVQRIINHLSLKSMNINELLVVTYTDSAAHEMKERLEVKLKEEINRIDSLEDKKYYLKQLQLLPQAQIKTLHSFCLHVIQNFFYIINLNPNIKLITDETEITIMTETVWQQLCENIYQEEVSDIHLNDLNKLLEIYSNSKSDTQLFDTINEIFRFSTSHPNSDQWLEQIGDIQHHFLKNNKQSFLHQLLMNTLTIRMNTVLKLFDTLVEHFALLNDESQTKFVENLEAEKNILNDTQKILDKGTLKDIIEHFNQFSLPKWQQNRTKDEVEKEKVAIIKEIRKQYEDILKEMSDYFEFSYEVQNEIEQEISRTVKLLGKLTKVFKQRFSEYKLQENVMEYSDLEHFTLNILAPLDHKTQKRKASSAANFYQNQFQEIMIDEYQDINEIQSTILYWLSKNAITDGTGNLFMVGDVKQSIYGFRLAEPQLFLDKYIEYQESTNDNLIVLDMNYRSRNEILQFTNFIFERIMNINFGEMIYGRNETLKHGNKNILPESGHPDFAIDLLLNTDENIKNTDAFKDSLEIECHMIAQEIQRLLKNNQQVFDKQTNEMRSLEYKDIVILSSTRKPFLLLQKVLEQYDIPVFSQKVESYYQRHEIQLMMALLKIINNPYQDIPLVAVLRSHFVGLSDTELAKIRIYHRTHQFYDACLKIIADKSIHTSNEMISIATKLMDFFERISTWRNFSMKKSMSQLIWQIYLDTQYLEYVLGQNNGDQRYANLHGLYQHAEAFESQKLRGLNQFIQYIEKMITNKKDLSEPILLKENQNFVQLMTVHASKGMEFPFVFLTNTGKKFNLKDTQKKILAHKNIGLTSDFYDTFHWRKFRSLSHKLSVYDTKNRIKAEEMRKFYVALTRCEQKLYIVGTTRSQESWHELIEKSKLLTEQELVVDQSIRESASSWLDWINMSLSVPSNHPKSLTDYHQLTINTQFINVEEIEENLPNKGELTGGMESLVDAIDSVFTQNEFIINTDEFKGLNNHPYAYSLATRTSSYQSVSELKRLNEEPLSEKMDTYMDRRNSQPQENQSLQGIRYVEDTFTLPDFMNKKKINTNYAKIGSLTHEFLQYLNFNTFINDVHVGDLLNSERQRMIKEGYFSTEEGNQIDLEKVTSFIQSDIGQYIIAHSSSLYREKAFSYRLPAKTIFNKQLDSNLFSEISDDFLIIHGIIDGYIIDNKQILMFDYKTDRLHFYSNMIKEEQMIAVKEKYAFQIELYKQALQTQYPFFEIKACLILLDFEETVIY